MSVLSSTSQTAAALRAVPHAHGRRRLAWWIRKGFGVLYIGGALYNVIQVVSDQSTYTPFADAAQWSFITDTWRSVVAPNALFFIGLLAAFELAVGVTMLSQCHWRIGLWAAAGFHVALLVFGWGLWLWILPVLALLAYALRDERDPQRSRR